MNPTRRFPINKFEERKDFRGGAGGKFKKDRERDKDGPRVNREIRAAQIRVIDDSGQMLGVMSVPEALRIAEDKGLDLLEIAPNAAPPTCKIMDYGKWKYENKKKAAIAKKKQVIVQIKEIQMRPRTDSHDFETKMKHARRFLLDSDKVKVTVKFLGREMSYQDQGREVMRKCIEYVKDLSLVEFEPKFEGKNMFVILAPDSVKIKEYLKLNPQKEKNQEQAKEHIIEDEEE